MRIGMPILLLCFTVRKPGLTFQEYKAYYKQHHSKNICTFLGEDSPSTYSRHYVERPSDGNSSHIDANGSPAMFITGQAQDFEYDGITIMTWADEAAFTRMTHKFASPEVNRQFTEDEEKLLDRSKILLLSVGKVPLPPLECRALRDRMQGHTE